MSSKRAISAVVTTLIILAALIVVFLVFFSFQRGAFLQFEPIFAKGSEATGEIPCTKGPTVSISPVTFIEPNGKDTVALNASLGSSCFESLDVMWTFSEANNSTATTETECLYSLEHNTYGTIENTTNKSSAYNCTTINHTYYANTADIWRTLPIKVSAFGLTSGFFTEDESIGFVKDPEFKFEKLPPPPQSPDPSDFSCVSITIAVRHTNVGAGSIITDPEKEGISLEIKDMSKTVTIEDVEPLAYATKIVYRAPWRAGTHKVELTATKLYQTTEPVELSYDAVDPNPYGRQEVAVFGGGSNGYLDIYSTKTSGKKAPINGSLFPDASNNEHKDFAVGDLNNDRVGEFAFLIGNDLFVQSYMDLKGSLSTELDKLSIEDLRRMWPDLRLPELNWKAVAISSKGIRSDNGVGNIIVLGNPGDLDLYRYANGLIGLVERGSDFKDVSGSDEWKDVTVKDIDNDNEDEVIALRTPGDLYIFKYKNYKAVGEKNPYWIDLDNRNWVAVAAGFLGDAPIGNAGENKVGIFSLGSPGDLYTLYYGQNIKSPFAVGGTTGHRSDWPDDVEWKDVAAGDIDRDGIDELLFLYKEGSDYKVAVIKTAAIFGNANFENKIANVEGNATNVIILQNSADWNSIAAGDVACI
jgi:hypothetical protein